MNKLDHYKPYSHVLIRITMSLVFLWFGCSQLSSPDMWAVIVPDYAANMLGGASTVVMLNGWFEVIAGVLLLIGFKVRIVSLLLGLHLIGIASSFGLSPTGVRDWALCLATLSIFIHGKDIWSLDTKWSPSTS